MVTATPIKLKNGTVFGVSVDLPVAPLLLIRADKGFLMCGYLNLDLAEQLSETAAVVRGVKKFEDMLEAKITGLTKHAENLGIRIGDTGRSALEKMIS